MASDHGLLSRRVIKAMIEKRHSEAYAIGDRTPAERDIALKMGVGRPVVRDAMLAMERLGLIEAAALAAQDAMHAHHAAVLQDLLSALEQDAVAAARQSGAATRERFIQTKS